MGVRQLLSALIAAAALAGCRDMRRPGDDPPAPAGPDVCWRLDAAGRFDAVAYDVRSLEQCAVYIEGLRLEEHHEVTGAWNGVYIHADAREVTASVRSHEGRYPIFRASDRTTIDANLALQIAARNGAATSGSTSPHRRGFKRDDIALTR
jgi:hypothetical protein